jgi:hypothetical protein
MMRAFTVKVSTRSGIWHKFTAIGLTSGDVHAAQLERFGGLCSVVVIPLQGAHP